MIVRDRSAIGGKVLSSTVVVAFGTLVVKAVAMGKELIVARTYGTSSTLDAFLIAFLLPSFAVNILANSLRAAFIPTYTQVYTEDGKQAARSLFGSMTIITFGFLLLISLCMGAFADHILPLLSSGFSGETAELTRRMFYWLLPILVLSGSVNLSGAVLNAKGVFASVALTPLATPLSIMIFLLFFHGATGVLTLPIAVAVGAIAEVCVIAYLMNKHKAISLPTWARDRESIKVIARQYAPLAIGAVLMCSTTVIDMSMAAMNDEGSVASLNYANKIPAFLLTIGGAIGVTLLPHFSRLVAEKKWRELRIALRGSVRLIVILSVPVTLLLVVLSEPIVRTIFQRLAFTEADTMQVANIQGWYLLQIPSFLLCLIAFRMISVLRATHLLMWGAALNLAVNTSLNVVLMKVMGVAGIALSTSLVYFASGCYLWTALTRVLRRAPVVDSPPIAS